MKKYNQIYAWKNLNKYKSWKWDEKALGIILYNTVSYQNNFTDLSNILLFS